VIGERTGGGANLSDLIRLNDHFVMNLPVGRLVSPFSKSSWEGVGVKPDIECSKEKAFVTAHIAALKKLIESSTDEKLKGQLKDILEKIQPTGK
jgi:retinol-binding protein 3